MAMVVEKLEGDLVGGRREGRGVEGDKWRGRDQSG